MYVCVCGSDGGGGGPRMVWVVRRPRVGRGGGWLEEEDACPRDVFLPDWLSPIYPQL